MPGEGPRFAGRGRRALTIHAILPFVLTATQAPVTTIALTGSDSFEALRPEWQELQDQGGAATFFQTWEWNSLWWRHLGRGTPYLLTFRRKDSLIGIAPCLLTTGPVKALRFVGSGTSDYLGLICAPQDQEEVASLFAHHLAEDCPGGYADLHQLGPDDPLATRFPGCRLAQARTVKLFLPDTWERYAATLTAKMRSNIKRAHRDLEAVEDCRVRATAGEETQQAMQTFFRLHGQRWRSRGLPGSFLHPKVKQFHSAWAEEAACRGWLRLSLIESAGKPFGTLYGIRYGDTYYYYQAGFDPKAAKLSPGTVLVAAAIRSAIEEGCNQFDFLRGEESYKTRWKPQEIGTNVRIVVPMRGMGGHWACNWLRQVQAVETRVRGRFEGGSLLARPK